MRLYAIRVTLRNCSRITTAETICIPTMQAAAPRGMRFLSHCSKAIKLDSTYAEGRLTPGVRPRIPSGRLYESYPETGLEEIGRERQSAAPHVSQEDLGGSARKSIRNSGVARHADSFMVPLGSGPFHPPRLPPVYNK